MSTKICGNCEQVIGNLESTFFYQGHVVCEKCSAILEDGTQATEVFESNIATGIPLEGIAAQEVTSPETITKDSSVKARCPRCQKLLNSTDEMIGETGVCPRCAEFSIKKFIGYGGIGRLGYFLGMLGLLFFQGFINVLSAESPGFGILGIATLVGFFVLVVKRLRNIGRSSSSAVFIIIPIANLFVLVPCLLCPEGYEDTKKLDIAGKIIAGTLIGLFVLGAGMLIVTAISS